MNTIAEFTIIGRVGEIKQVGSTLRVSVASSFSRRDNSGEWIERLCKGPNHGEDNGPEAQESRRPPVDDSDIPF